jgi:hypothetical protein
LKVCEGVAALGGVTEDGAFAAGGRLNVVVGVAALGGVTDEGVLVPVG